MSCAQPVASGDDKEVLAAGSGAQELGSGVRFGGLIPSMSLGHCRGQWSPFGGLEAVNDAWQSISVSGTAKTDETDLAVLMRRLKAEAGCS